MIKIVTWVTDPLLRELLYESIYSLRDFALVGEATDPVNLYSLVAESEANVVLCSWMDGGQVPEACLQLLADFPDLFVAGVVMNDDAVVLCWQEIQYRNVQSVGVDRLFSEIRQGCNRKTCGGAFTHDHSLSAAALSDSPFPFSRN